MRIHAGSIGCSQKSTCTIDDSPCWDRPSTTFAKPVWWANKGVYLVTTISGHDDDYARFIVNLAHSNTLTLSSTSARSSIQAASNIPAHFLRTISLHSLPHPKTKRLVGMIMDMTATVPSSFAQSMYSKESSRYSPEEVGSLLKSRAFDKSPRSSFIVSESSDSLYKGYSLALGSFSESYAQNSKRFASSSWW
jgi:hypothetical protein